MILFPLILFQILIYGALLLTGTGFAILLFLLWKDTRSRSIW